MNKNLQLLGKAIPLGSLEAYIHWANQVPILSQEEEHNLSTQFIEKHDLIAAQKLVMAHLRFVVHVAKGYLGYGLQIADLIQEGNIGLMKAVKRFNPKHGVRLVSFAIHWIKAEIHEFILRNWRIVKMATTKAQRKLFFNLRSMAKKFGRLGLMNEEEINIVAKELKVKPKEVMAMEMRLNNQDVALESFTDNNEENPRQSPITYLEDPNGDPAKQLEGKNWELTQEQNLNNALLKLDDRSRDILRQRWLNAKKATLHELAAKYAISAERVRQVEEMAMLKLKGLIINS